MLLPSVGRAIDDSQVIGYWDNLGETGPYPKSHAGTHMESNPKSSAPYFTSDETLL